MAVDVENIDPTLVVLEEDATWYEDIHGEGTETADLGGQDGPNNVAVKQLIGRGNFLKKKIEDLDLDDSHLARKNGSSNEKFNVKDATQDSEAINKGQLDTALSEVDTSGFVKKTGDTMTGSLNVDMGRGNYLTAKENSLHLFANHGTEDEKEMMLNMYDSGTNFSITPSGNGKEINYDWEDDTWSIGGSKILLEGGEKDFNFTFYEFNTDNGLDTRISAENIWGDTNVQLEREQVYVRLVGNMAFIKVKLKIVGFNKTVPNDTICTFKYALIDSVSSVCDITAFSSWEMGDASFVMSGAENGSRDVARQSAYTSLNPNDGLVLFTINDTVGHDSGSATPTSNQVDTLTMQASYAVKVERG